MITSRIEAGFGADAIAVSKIGSQIESLSWLIGGGFGQALIAFIGQNYGAEKWDRIRKGVRLSAAAMTVWGIFVALLLWFAGGRIFAVFLPDAALTALGVSYLRILAFAQLPMNIEAIGGGAFKGTGCTIPPTISSIVSNAFKPVLALLLSRTSLGLYGIWIAVCVGDILKGAWVCVWYVVVARKQGATRQPLS
jgi:Na+-driven multidrug efflux pump